MAYFLLFLLTLTASASANQVTIYRDAWGVPHIYGDTEEAAAYGHGYAQAEDRLDDILSLYTIVQGKAARAFGPEYIQKDYESRLTRHAELARANYAQLSPHVRQMIEYYVRGILDYLKENPDKKPEWASTPNPYHVVALYRAFIYDWPWGQALSDLQSPVIDGRGSNQWVVSASRSAEGGPIALIDPHLSWTPANRFYESHLHGGDLNFYGFSIVGTPFMALGHTNVFSLSATTGGPDCADVYEIQINPANPLQYRYDDTWRDVDVLEIEIEVKTSNGIAKETRRIERTHHGPIVKRLGDRGFVIKTAYDEEIGFVEQLYNMLRAKNLGEFLHALSANQMLPQNIMYADIYGNIYYIRAGRVPIRPEGYHWDRPVPGWTSRSEWRGIHPLSDLVQVLNPGVGYMQNCNISPGAMMPNSPLLPHHYPTYIYNDKPDRTNLRGRRALQLLEVSTQLTLSEAMKIAVDTYVIDAARWQKALLDAFDTHETPFVHLGEAVRQIADWNGYMDPDSPGASLFRFWMRACRAQNSDVPISLVETGRPLAGGAQRTLLRALDRAVEDMHTYFGRIDVPWGDIHRAARGGESWPIGGYSGNGIGPLRTVTSAAPDETGISYVRGGQFCTTVVVLNPNGIISYSATPYGQSNHPDSPHHTDQGRLLYSQSRLKPTWYNRSDMLERAQSKRTFKIPDAP